MRVIICIKDIESVTGRTYRSSKYYMAKLRKHYGKQRHQLVTVQEFCTYSGLPLQEVIDHLRL